MVFFVCGVVRVCGMVCSVVWVCVPTCARVHAWYGVWYAMVCVWCVIQYGVCVVCVVCVIVWCVRVWCVM